jgi:multiple antibiotic resistance protein
MGQRLFRDFVTLFVVVNPIGLVPLFIAITGHDPLSRRRRLALEAVIIAAVILMVFIVIGQPLLEALGIELASFQLAGGLVLLIIALRMVLAETRPGADAWPVEAGNVAVFPLAMPFIAGPATLMAVVLLTDNNVYDVSEQVSTAVTLLAVLAITYGCMVAADLLQRLLGMTGTNVVSRIMGLILAALAIQSMVGGLRGLRML